MRISDLLTAAFRICPNFAHEGEIKKRVGALSAELTLEAKSYADSGGSNAVRGVRNFGPARTWLVEKRIAEEKSSSSSQSQTGELVEVNDHLRRGEGKKRRMWKMS